MTNEHICKPNLDAGIHQTVRLSNSSKRDGITVSIKILCRQCRSTFREIFVDVSDSQYEMLKNSRDNDKKFLKANKKQVEVLKKGMSTLDAINKLNELKLKEEQRLGTDFMKDFLTEGLADVPSMFARPTIQRNPLI